MLVSPTVRCPNGRLSRIFWGLSCCQFFHQTRSVESLRCLVLLSHNLLFFVCCLLGLLAGGHWCMHQLWILVVAFIYTNQNLLVVVPQLVVSRKEHSCIRNWHPSVVESFRLVVVGGGVGFTKMCFFFVFACKKKWFFDKDHDGGHMPFAGRWRYICCPLRGNDDDDDDGHHYYYDDELFSRMVVI